MSHNQTQQNQISGDMAVQYLKGVGPAKAKIFENIGVKTVSDLLEYFPRDWRFMAEPVKIKDLQAEHEVSVIGQIEGLDYRPYSRMKPFEVTLADDSDVCRVVWFRGGYLNSQLEPGQVLIVSGKVSKYKHVLQFTNPKFMIVEDGSVDPEKYFGGGIYRSSGKLTSGQIKKIMRPVLEEIENVTSDFFSKNFRKKNNLVSRAAAFRQIHMPEDEQQLKEAKRRLKYDELFLMQVALALRRYKIKHFTSSPVFERTEEIDRRIRRRFPFLLTADQNEAIEDIVKDMGKPVPMNRLLQGDVGSGKTVVALYAALLAVAGKGQVVFMAPTEILANQHYLSIEKYLKGSKVKRALITGGMKPKKRSEILEKVKSGDIDIVVGTVALLQSDIEFKSLALAIIDEQHKFGVEQRALLRKDSAPHTLVMTATPIPRTLAMTAFGDLDVSTIKTMPPGRGTIITRWVDRKNQRKAEEFIRQRLKAKRQAYFVYPRIAAEENGDDESKTIKAATKEYETLSKKVYPEFNVGLLHGQMSSDEKRAIMKQFRDGDLDVLVSTVVIEVGVDVANATIMVIEGADHFGLAQLHQLRGRIGRGEAAKSYCFLFADTESEMAQSRLDVMTRTNDGFEIAEYDLKLRGPGELFSTRQHGLPDLKIANIIDDYELLTLARKDAFTLVDEDPMLRKAENKNIRKALIEKFGNSLPLGDIA